MAADLIAVPVQPRILAAALERHPDYRVLRRMEELVRSASHDEQLETMTGVAVDVETTGLDVATCSIIELAMQSFRADASGRIVATGPSRSWLEDPGVSLSPVISRLTGLTDDHLCGRAISDGEATSMLLSADMVVAHNAGFDRPFVEKRLPEAAGRNWICSMRDLDWAGHGFDGRSLGHLLGQCGWFYQAHRASTDVTALLHLLDHPLGGNGTVLGKLIDKAKESSWRLDAVRAPFEAKDLLRGRGYRWDAERRLWTREVSAEALAQEQSWLETEVYRGRGTPVAEEVNWSIRYSRR